MTPGSAVGRCSSVPVTLTITDSMDNITITFDTTNYGLFVSEAVAIDYLAETIQVNKLDISVLFIVTHLESI